MQLSMGLPTKEEELAILNRYSEKEPLAELDSILTLDELLTAREKASHIFVHPCVMAYLVDIVDATRNAENILSGVSPRGSLALLRCAKAYAYLQGREYVIPDDIRLLSVPVLAHRLVLGYGASGTEDAKSLIRQLLDRLPVPTEDFTL